MYFSIEKKWAGVTCFAFETKFETILLYFSDPFIVIRSSPFSNRYQLQFSLRTAKNSIRMLHDVISH